MFGNDSEDMLVEVSHGPTMIDHNIMLSGHSFKTLSYSCALVHNLMAGTISAAQDINRHTPYHVPHSTSVAGMNRFTGGDDRYFNNIFLREKDDPRSDEPYLEGFFGNDKLNPEDVKPNTCAFMSYPVGTAVYNDYPGPDDEPAWMIFKRLFTGQLKKAKRLASFAILGGPIHPVFIENNVYFNRALPYKKKRAKVYDDSGISTRSQGEQEGHHRDNET